MATVELGWDGVPDMAAAAAALAAKHSYAQLAAAAATVNLALAYANAELWQDAMIACNSISSFNKELFCDLVALHKEQGEERTLKGAKQRLTTNLALLASAISVSVQALIAAGEEKAAKLVGF